MNVSAEDCFHGRMIAASVIAIFLIPVTFYVIERLFAGRKVAIERPAKAPVAELIA